MLTPGVEPGKIALADFKSTVFTISPSELIFESIFYLRRLIERLRPSIKPHSGHLWRNNRKEQKKPD